MTDLLDDELTSAFDRAHDASQWAAPTWTDPVDRIHRASARARTRTAIAGAGGLALVAGGVIAAVTMLPSGQDRVLVPADGGNGSQGTGRTGAQWLLSPNDYESYTAAHPSPSASPDSVPSPAPVDGELTRLQTDIVAALPAGAEIIRADAADGGAPGHATVWLRLADGTPVAVERYQLDYPLDLSWPVETSSDGQSPPVTEHTTQPEVWSDGTAYTVLTGTASGYGFGGGTQWSGPFVWTVTPDGWFTTWTAPVSVDKLLSWAQSADGSFVGGG